MAKDKFDILVQVDSFDWKELAHSNGFYNKIISATENFFQKEGFSPKGVNGYEIEGELGNVCYAEFTADEAAIRKFLSENDMWAMGDVSECDGTYIGLCYHEPYKFWNETSKLESDDIGTSDLTIYIQIWCDGNYALLNKIYSEYLD